MLLLSQFDLTAPVLPLLISSGRYDSVYISLMQMSMYLFVDLIFDTELKAQMVQIIQCMANNVFFPYCSLNHCNFITMCVEAESF